MTTVSHRKGPEALDFKSATLYTLRIVLHSSNLDELLEALAQRMRDAGSFFEDEAAVIDATELSTPIAWPPLLDALREHKLNTVGIVAQGEVLSSAIEAGLNEVDIANVPTRPSSQAITDANMPALAVHEASNATAQANSSAAATTQEATTQVAPAALIINRQLRSGQRVYARDTDLVVIGAVGQGAEVIADGNIHVYGPLRGKAMAGARGDSKARIFTTELDPELIAIAGVYRVIEESLESEVHKKTTVIQLEDEQLKIRTLS